MENKSGFGKDILTKIGASMAARWLYYKIYTHVKTEQSFEFDFGGEADQVTYGCSIHVGDRYNWDAEGESSGIDQIVEVILQELSPLFDLDVTNTDGSLWRAT